MKTYFRLLFAFLALGLLAAAVVGVVYVWEELIVPKREVQAEIDEIRTQAKTKTDHGEKVYRDAVGQLRTGQVNAGVASLHKVMTYYRDSSIYREAKRIVGEINVDRLLSKAPMPGKAEYIVQSGDVLSRIASREKSTVGYIIHVNGRMGSNLQRGDQLIVCPLEFSIAVDLKGKALILKNAEDQFFKEYTLLDFKRPANTPSEFNTSVKSLVVSTGARLVPVGTPKYVGAEKELRCTRGGVAIRSKTGDADKDKYITGIFLAPEDIEELALLIRPGTKVLVRK